MAAFRISNGGGNTSSIRHCDASGTLELAKMWTVLPCIPDPCYELCQTTRSWVESSLGLGLEQVILGGTEFIILDMVTVDGYFQLLKLSSEKNHIGLVSTKTPNSVTTEKEVIVVTKEDTEEVKDILTTVDVPGHIKSHKESSLDLRPSFDLYLSLFNKVLVPGSFKEQMKSVRHTICLNGPQVLKARDEKFNIKFVKYFSADGIILAEMTNGSAYPSN
ncbi:hypothetical protein BTVI_75316 [Pitangus sulphuratus]|nr:hypothetical protein BTVI_75316 [Pitangus sulphuratus]